MTCCAIQPRHGVSLIEVLVVIGIVGLLLAILLPTLARVRDHAHAVSCASQLRQIGMALASYADDHDGNYPRDQTPWRADRVARPYEPIIGGQPGRRRGFAPTLTPKSASSRTPRSTRSARSPRPRSRTVVSYRAPRGRCR